MRHVLDAIHALRTVSAGLLAALSFAGCDVSDIPADPRRVTMAVSRDISTLDPAATFVISNQLAINLAYEKLVVAEVADGKPTGRFLGQLAERWTSSDDGLQWTFYLHPGHRFDDGSEVTAEALPGFPGGLFVAMSTDRTFHYYAWDDIAAAAKLK